MIANMGHMAQPHMPPPLPGAPIYDVPGAYMAHTHWQQPVMAPPLQPRMELGNVCRSSGAEDCWQQESQAVVATELPCQPDYIHGVGSHTPMEAGTWQEDVPKAPGRGDEQPNVQH
jgi:hypothetical protein